MLVPNEDTLGWQIDKMNEHDRDELVRDAVALMDEGRLEVLRKAYIRNWFEWTATSPLQEQFVGLSLLPQRMLLSALEYDHLRKRYRDQRQDLGQGPTSSS